MSTPLLLLAFAVTAILVAYARDPGLVGRGLSSAARLVRGVWVELALGFILAGLLDVLVPQSVVSRWLGNERLWQGVFVGWAAGLMLPGGPYLLFPIVANLLANGAAPGPIITLLTAKLLVNIVRMLTYEAPILGWPLTLARLLPSILVPPVLGILGQLLFLWLQHPRA